MSTSLWAGRIKQNFYLNHNKSQHFVFFPFRFHSYTLDNIPGRRIGMFSYGSGFASTLFSIKVSNDGSPGSPLWKLMASLQDLQQRLDSRQCVEPSVFAAAMKLRQDTHHLCKWMAPEHVHMYANQNIW